jgi:hypothetical protein
MSNTNILAAMLKQYESNTNSYTKTEQKVYDLKNYFTTYLKDKEKSATRRIRILPTKDGSSPFVEVHGHKMQVDGEWKTYVCLKHEKGEDCPFCEAREALLATGKESDKELAKKYSAKKMYVVKVIDRDNEADGPKFWRFNHDYRKTGTLDKIYGVLQAVNKDITDPTIGRDLLVMVARDQNNRPIVQSISHVDPSPLSDDADLANEWLADERTWEDVYSVKPYEYLEIVVKGGVPTWDKDAKKWVDKASMTASEDGADMDAELTLGTPNVKPNVVASNAAPQVAPIADGGDDEDDLPF